MFGHLSDRMGRKPIILGGCLIAAITYVPISAAMNAVAEPLHVHQRGPADAPCLHPSDLRDHGVRADRRVPGGAVPGQFIVGTFLKETSKVRIWDEVGGAMPATADRPAKVVSVPETSEEPTGRPT
jgi:MFS family permease